MSASSYSSLAVVAAATAQTSNLLCNGKQGLLAFNHGNQPPSWSFRRLSSPFFARNFECTHQLIFLFEDTTMRANTTLACSPDHWVEKITLHLWQCCLVMAISLPILPWSRLKTSLVKVLSVFSSGGKNQLIPTWMRKRFAENAKSNSKDRSFAWLQPFIFVFKAFPRGVSFILAMSPARHNVYSFSVWLRWPQCSGFCGDV